MKLSAIEAAVLGRCGNDFEAPHTIAAEVSSEIGRSVSELEVKEALEVLGQGGLVEKYLLLPCKAEFVQVEASAVQSNQSVWYKVSERGRRDYEAS